MFSRTILFTTLLATTTVLQGANYLAYQELQKSHPMIEFSPLFKYPSQLNGYPADVTSTLPFVGSFRYRVSENGGWRCDYEHNKLNFNLHRNFDDPTTTSSFNKWWNY